MDQAARNDQGQTGPKASLGKYLIVRELGSGGMAQVFEGRHPELGCAVALKVLRPAIAAQPQAAARFLREARAMAQIQHPNIVRVFDIGMERDAPFIVMEFLDGTDVATLLAKKGTLGLGSIVELFLPVISAVATAHAASVIHRDLKPANLMVACRPPRGMHPYVLDFGISKMTTDEGEGTLTRSESLLGTIQYMAPELTRGAKFATAQSDQYALGIMLYECATGRRPFTGNSHYELMHAIVTAPIEPPSRLNPSLPQEFDAIVLRAMAREPALRFASIHALGRALLSLGDRGSSNPWTHEFVGSPADDDLWSRAPATLSDQGPTSGLVSPGPRARQGGKLWRWLGPLLIVYAAFTTWLLVRRSPTRAAASSAQAATQAPTLMETSGPISSPTRASTSSAMSSAPAVASAPAGLSTSDLSPSAGPSVAPVIAPERNDSASAQDRAANRRERALKEVGGPKRPTTSAPSEATTSAPQTGTNGVFIID